MEVPIFLACQAADEGIGNVDLCGTTRALVLELRPNVIQYRRKADSTDEGFRLRVHMSAPCRHRYTRYKRRRARCGVAPAIDGLLVPHALHLQRRLLFIQVRLCRVQQPQSIRLPWRPHTCLTSASRFRACKRALKRFRACRASAMATAMRFGSTTFASSKYVHIARVHVHSPAMFPLTCARAFGGSWARSRLAILQSQGPSDTLAAAGRTRRASVGEWATAGCLGGSLGCKVGHVEVRAEQLDRLVVERPLQPTVLKANMWVHTTGSDRAAEAATPVGFCIGSGLGGSMRAFALPSGNRAAS